jgi:5'-3' exonuclease
MLMANLATNEDYWTKDGEYLGGVVGMLTQINGLITEYKPKNIFVTFDLFKSKYRQELLPSYKSGRHLNVDEDLAKRFEFRAMNTSYLKLLLPMLGIYVLIEENIEADDVIANFIYQSTKDTLLVSTDKDFIQLLRPNLRILRNVRPESILLTSDNINDKLGFDHKYYLPARFLEGDKSDAIAGTKGIGPKTAIKIFTEAGGIDKRSIKEYALSMVGKYKWASELVKFCDESWDLNEKLMDLSKGPSVNIKSLISKPQFSDKVNFNYDEALKFLNDLSLDDCMFEDVETLLYAFDKERS